MGDERVITFRNWDAGLKNARSQFSIEESAISDGRNVELYRGAKTRPGYEIVSAYGSSSSPGEIAGALHFANGTIYYFGFEGTAGELVHDETLTDMLNRTWTVVRVGEGVGETYKLDTTQKYSGSMSLLSGGATAAETWRGLIVTSSVFDLSNGEDFTIRCYVRMATGYTGNSMVVASQQRYAPPIGPDAWLYTIQDDGADFSIINEAEEALVEIAWTGGTITRDTWWRFELRYDGTTGTYTIAADEAASWTGNGTTRAQSSSGQVAPIYIADQPMRIAYVKSGSGNMQMWIDDIVIIHGSDTPVDAVTGAELVTAGVERLTWVRHPTTEAPYLIAQVIDPLQGTNTLTVCGDTLPDAALEFELLYSLGTGDSVASIATLGDRTIICTDEEEPLVFSGGLDAASALCDWPHPYQVLMRPVGSVAYDISAEVLDKDSDVSHTIGGVQSGGDMLIVTEVPYVKGFYFTFDTVNSGPGAGSGTTATGESEFDGSGDADIEDIKGGCTQWNQSATVYGNFEGTEQNLDATTDIKDLCVYWNQWAGGTAGNFEGAEQNLDNAAAVDKGGGLVGIPLTGHGYSSGQKVTIYDTTNYNGEYVLDATTSSNEMVITETYNAETFAGTEGCRLRPTLGVGGDQPNIVVGLYVEINSNVYTISVINGDGSSDGNVVLSGSVTDNAVTYIGEAAVTNEGGGKVGIPCTGHGYSSGDYVIIGGTTNYNGIYALDASTTADVMVIVETYTAELLDGSETVSYRPTLGTGNNEPRIEPGLKVTINSTDYYIVAITSDGEQDGEVELSAAQADYAVTGIYGLTVDSSYIQTVHEGTTGTSILTAGLKTGHFCGGCPADGWSCRVVIPAADLTDTAWTEIKITFTFPTAVAAATSSTNKYVNNAAVGTRDSGANTTSAPVELLFSGASGFYVTSLPATQESDWTTFSGDGTDDIIVIIDIPAKFTEGTYEDVLGNTRSKFGPTIGCKNNVTGPIIYYKEDDTSYDTATVTGYSTADPYWLGISDVEVRNAFDIPTGRFIMAGTSTVEVSTGTAQHITGVSVTSTEGGSSSIHHAVSFDGNRTIFKAYKASTWLTIASDSTGTWQYYNGASMTNADEDTMESALYQAFGVAGNQMTTAQLEAITEAQWEAAGGFVANLTPSLSFAASLTSDGTNVPVLQKYTVGLYDEGSANIEYYASGAWTDGSGFTDGTLSGSTPFGQDGAVSYDGDYAEPSLTTMEGVQGYFFKLLFPTGLSSDTSLTRVQVQYEPQLIRNLDDGLKDLAVAVLMDNGNSVQDFSIVAADNVHTDESSVWLCDGDPASSPAAFGTSGALYIGNPWQFNRLMLMPNAVYYNSNAATVSAYYWNGTQWTALTVTDNTTVSGATMGQTGTLDWTLPTNWKKRPLDQAPGLVPVYWVKITVSADLTAPTALWEVRLFDVPDALPKYRCAAVAGNRVVLANRPDAPSQIDISREGVEFGFAGSDSYSINLGGDEITAVFTAWNTIMVVQPDRMTAIDPTSLATVRLGVSNVPPHERVIVQAPLSPDQPGILGVYFLDESGAYVYTGLQADTNFGTGRAVMISREVDWWDDDADLRIDKDYLHMACGAHYRDSVRNYVLFSVPMIESGGSSQASNNYVIVWDINLGAWLDPWKYDIGFSSFAPLRLYNAEAPGGLGATALYAGTYGGEVARLFSTTTDNGTAIAAWFETGAFDFGVRDVKEIYSMDLLALSSEDITISFYRDGDSALDSNTLTYADVNDPSGKDAQWEHESLNGLASRWWKFRFDFTGPTSIEQVNVGIEPGEDYPDKLQ